MVVVKPEMEPDDYLEQFKHTHAHTHKKNQHEIKSLIHKGRDCDIKRANTILPDQEEILWEKGLLVQKRRVIADDDILHKRINIRSQRI